MSSIARSSQTRSSSVRCSGSRGALTPVIAAESLAPASGGAVSVAISVPPNPGAERDLRPAPLSVAASGISETGSANGVVSPYSLGWRCCPAPGSERRPLLFDTWKVPGSRACGGVGGAHGWPPRSSSRPSPTLPLVTCCRRPGRHRRCSRPRCLAPSSICWRFSCSGFRSRRWCAGVALTFRGSSRGLRRDDRNHARLRGAPPRRSAPSTDDRCQPQRDERRDLPGAGVHRCAGARRVPPQHRVCEHVRDRAGPDLPHVRTQHQQRADVLRRRQDADAVRAERHLRGLRVERRLRSRRLVGRRPRGPPIGRPGYVDRLRVHSGITGWAQANDLRGRPAATWT